MDGVAIKTRGRKRTTKKQEAVAVTATAAEAAGAAAAAAPKSVAAPTATAGTATEATDADDAIPKPSLSQRLVKSLKQLSQLGAGSKTEDGDEVEQQQRQPEDEQQREDEQEQQQQQQQGYNSSEEGHGGLGEEAEGTGDGRFAGGVVAAARRLQALLLPPRARLPPGVSWPAAAAAAALLLLLLAGGLLAAGQARASGRQLSSLQRQLSTQHQAAAAARDQLDLQVAALQHSVQQLEGRLGASSCALEALQHSFGSQAGAAASLAAELSQARDDIAQLQLTAASAATAPPQPQQQPQQANATSAAAAGAEGEDAAKEAAAEGIPGLSSPATAAAAGAGPPGSQRLRQVVHGDVSAALELFAADRTGLPDYALAAVGAAVVAHSAAHLPPAAARLGSLPKLVPAQLRGGSVHPQASKLLLAPIAQQGACLPLVGSSGFVDIRLAHPIHPTAFTYEHIPARIAFDIRSAPRNLTLMGYRGKPPPPPAAAATNRDRAAAPPPAAPAPADAGDNDSTGSPASSGGGGASGGGGVPLGRFSYDVHSGHAVQTYQLGGAPPLAPGLVIDHVRLAVEANHGHPDYTCLYRVRVHGTPPAG